MSKNRRRAQNNRLPNGQFPKGVTGNPNGRPRLDTEVLNAHELADARLDAAHWFNLSSSLGVDGYDKSMGSDMCVEPVSDEEARMIYRGDSFGARIADARPREMFRAGWKLKISDVDVEKQRATEGEPKLSRQDARRLKRRLDALASKTKDMSERVMNRARDLGVNEKFKRALTLANVDGGSAILLGANDNAKNWKDPLNTRVINSPEKLSWLTVIEARHLEPVAWYTNPQAPKYGEVAIWRINPIVEGGGIGVDTKYVPKPIEVHESRMIVFQGIKLTEGSLAGVRNGFGDSIYTRLKNNLARYALGWNAASILLNEFSLAILKTPMLAETMATDKPGKVLRRAAAVKLGQSIARMTVIGKDEELTRDTASVAGVADLLYALMQELAGQADVPVTILMGMSPAGLNATGESDTRGWYDRIASEWSDKIDPKMRYVVSLILRSVNGGKEPEKWCIDLNPLWQESPKERAETRFIDAQTDEKNIMNQLYTPEEARRSRFGGDEYGEEINIDLDEGMDEYDQDLEEAKKMQAEGALPKMGSELPKMGTPAPTGKPGDTIPVNAPETPAQNAAFNGAQVTSLIEVSSKVALGELSREAGKAILMIAFPINAEQAEAALGPTNFKPTKPEPPPSPFAGAPKPPIPTGKKPPVEKAPILTGKK